MLSKIQDTIVKYNKKVWLMYNVNNLDPYFCKYISELLDTNSICMITPRKIYLLVSSLDFSNISTLKYDKNKIQIFNYDNSSVMLDTIEDIIDDLKFPAEISLSYSTMRDSNVDILSHGQYIDITKMIKDIYTKYSKKVRFTSAENIIYDIESERTELQINRLKLIAKITSEILEKTFKELEIGMTEIGISYLTKQNTSSVMKKYINTNDITAYDMAWDICPIVLTGENLKNGGHSIPSTKVLKEGDTIYFDFGIKVNFEDGESLYSDMQRMGYALKRNENDAPKEIVKVFETLINSIEDGIEAMKPGVKGYKVDEIVRSHILKAGYPDYNHATGHPVGLNVHDTGTIISMKGSKRSALPLIENGVYTLEPRIAIENGGSIEEMIQVTKYGGIPLCDPQRKLYLVR